MAAFLFIDRSDACKEAIIVNTDHVTSLSRGSDGSLNIYTVENENPLILNKGDMTDRVWKTFMNMSREPHRG